MNDIFEHKERKVYKRTFLQQVDVRLEYPVIDKDELTSEFVEATDGFFRNYFQLESSESPLAEKDLLIKYDDQQLAFNFSPNACMLSVGYENYKTFYESVLPYLYPVKEYSLNILGRSPLHVGYRKLNVFSFDNDAKDDVEKESRLFLQNVFSPEFLNAEVSTSNEIIGSENTKVSVRDFLINDFRLELRTYFLHPKDGVSSLFFDSRVYFDADSSNLEELLTIANSLLYDSYHWAVSDGIINIMNNDAEV